MSDNFKAGDTVRLKSGGPLMTISYVNQSNDFVGCEWFDDKNLKSGDFRRTSLKIDDDDVHVSYE